MTHIDIDYSKLTGEDKSKKAIADIKSYLGEAKYNELSEAFKKDEISLNKMEMLCGLFIGIEGYPVIAWYEELFA